MPKRSKKSRLNLIRHWLREHKFKTLLLLIGLTWLIFLGYNRVLAWQEKKEYEKARLAIEALYADIENKIGKPNKTVRDSSCGYGSAKFTRGPRGCSVSIKFTYNVSGPSDTTDRAKQIQGLTLKHFNITYSDFNIKFPFRSLDSEKERDASSGMYIIHNEAVADIEKSIPGFFVKGYRGCSLSFRYGKGDDYNLRTLDDGAQENLMVRLGCGGDARAEHYPVTN